MECKKIENLKYCPCINLDCEKRGICCLCLKYHLSKKELPTCCFSKEAFKTHDRSFECFIKENKKI